MSDRKPWERQPGETAKAYDAFLHYRDLPAIDRSVVAAWGRKWGRKLGGKQWERWCTVHNWPNRAAEHDSDLASRRRERMAKALERSQDDAVIMIRAMRARVAERIKGMDVDELAAGQIPGALKRLFELEWKALGMEDNLNLKHEGKIEVEAAADTAWLMDYLRSLPERANDKPEGEGNAKGRDRTSDSAPDAGGSGRHFLSIGRPCCATSGAHGRGLSSLRRQGIG